MLFDDISGFQVGQKIDITGESGAVIIAADGSEQALGGTYLVESIDPNAGALILMNVQREHIQTRGVVADAANVSTYSLSGANYFYFFAWLTVAAAALFMVVSRFFTEKQYIQSLDDAENAPA